MIRYNNICNNNALTRPEQAIKLVVHRQTDRLTDRPTDRPPDRQTDIVTYRAAIAAKNVK